MSFRSSFSKKLKNCIPNVATHTLFHLNWSESFESDWLKSKSSACNITRTFSKQRREIFPIHFFLVNSILRSGADLLSLNHWSHLSSFLMWFFFFLSHQSRLIGHNELLLLGLSPFPQSPSHFLFQKTWNNQNDLFADGRQELCHYLEIKFKCLKKNFCKIAVSSYSLNFFLKIETHQVFKMILSVLNLPPTFFFQHPVWKDLTALSQTGPKRSKVVELGLKRPLLAQKVQDNMDDPNLS